MHHLYIKKHFFLLGKFHMSLISLFNLYISKFLACRPKVFSHLPSRWHFWLESILNSPWLTALSTLPLLFQLENFAVPMVYWQFQVICNLFKNGGSTYQPLLPKNQGQIWCIFWHQRWCLCTASWPSLDSTSSSFIFHCKLSSFLKLQLFYHNLASSHSCNSLHLNCKVLHLSDLTWSFLCLLTK